MAQNLFGNDLLGVVSPKIQYVFTKPVTDSPAAGFVFAVNAGAKPQAFSAPCRRCCLRTLARGAAGRERKQSVPPCFVLGRFPSAFFNERALFFTIDALACIGHIGNCAHAAPPVRQSYAFVFWIYAKFRIPKKPLHAPFSPWRLTSPTVFSIMKKTVFRRRTYDSRRL